MIQKNKIIITNKNAKKVIKFETEQKKFFYQDFFYIKKGVFLPRFESEQLLDITISYIKTLFPKKINILEVGCGSGVIAINLALTNPLWKVDGVDISLKALNLSKKNLNLHPLLKVNFKKSDLFQNITKKYHVIIANLPYVENTFPIKPQILKWDPVCALFAGVDGLKLLDKLLQQINKYIYKKYLIALEIGYKQKEGMIKLI